MKAAHLLILPLAALVLAACNGDLDVGDTSAARSNIETDPAKPTGPLQGTVNGAPFKSVSAIAYRGEWGSLGSLHEHASGPHLRLVFSDSEKLNCDSRPMTVGSTTFRVEIPEDMAKPTAMGLSAPYLVLLDVMEAGCRSSPEAATEGSVSLSSVGPMVEGTIDATFATGRVSGAFSIQVCPVEPPIESWCR